MKGGVSATESFQSKLYSQIFLIIKYFYKTCKQIFSPCGVSIGVLNCSFVSDESRWKKSKFKRFPSYLRLFSGVGQTPVSTAAESFGNFLKQSVFFPLGPVFFKYCIFFFFCIIIKNLVWFLGIFEMLFIFCFKTNFIFLENLLLFGKLFVAFSFFSACCTLYRFCFKLPWIFPDHAYIFKGCIFKSRDGFRATSDKREWKVQMWDLRFSRYQSSWYFERKIYLFIQNPTWDWIDDIVAVGEVV